MSSKTINNSYLIPIYSIKYTLGYRRCVIQDFSRKKILLANRSLYIFLQDNKKKSIKEIYDKYPNQKKDVDDYLNFLLDNEFIFWGSKDETKSFIKQSEKWDYPAHVTNAYIEYSVLTKQSINSIIEQFSTLGVEAVEIYCSIKISLKELSAWVMQIEQIPTIRSVQISVYYDKSISIDDYISFADRHPFIERIIVINSPYSKLFEEKNIIFVNEKADSSNCGIIDIAYFTSSLMFFTESQKHNTCLNRKLCIDANGYVKNCPAMEKHYGRIDEVSLEEVIRREDFQQCWFINKDRIDVCKDCEFRHMCTDCRCFIKDPENIFSQPAKCTYNPYICKWQGEEGYVPVEECGTYSRETGFVPDKKKIKALNKKIWNEE